MDREEALKILEYNTAQCNSDCKKCIYNDDDNDKCVIGSINNVIMNTFGYNAVWEAQKKYETIANEISLQELYITLKDFRFNLCETYHCAECPFLKTAHGTVQCCILEAQNVIREKLLNNTP